MTRTWGSYKHLCDSAFAVGTAGRSGDARAITVPIARARPVVEEVKNAEHLFDASEMISFVRSLCSSLGVVFVSVTSLSEVVRCRVQGP
jgi:hypothetical protein